jgi:hypothetical protein
VAAVELIWVIKAVVGWLSLKQEQAVGNHKSSKNPKDLKDLVVLPSKEFISKAFISSRKQVT